MRRKRKAALTPQQKAEEARLRISTAIENLISRGGAWRSHIDRIPLSVVAAILLGGFVIGYSPQMRRTVVHNLAEILRFLVGFEK